MKKINLKIFLGLSVVMVASIVAVLLLSSVKEVKATLYYSCTISGSGYCNNGPSSINSGGCGTACGFGQAWTKYSYTRLKICAPCSSTCSGCCSATVYDKICSTGDKCVSGEKGLRCGYCNCTYGSSIYKSCCDGSTPKSCAKYAIQDPYPPDEGVCPSGSQTISGSSCPVTCGSCQYKSGNVCYNNCSGADTSCGCASSSCINCNSSDNWYNVGSTSYCCNGTDRCICQNQEYRDYRCSGTSCAYSVTSTRTTKSGCTACGSCQYCSGGSCYNNCSGADTSCGCASSSCINCNSSDNWYNVGSTSYCCNGTDRCICQNQEYRDYRCSGTSCAYSVTSTKTLKSSCSSHSSCVTCSDECFVGQKQCSGNYSQNCVNCDSDSCLDWCNYEYCSYGCSGGVCAGAPPPPPSPACGDGSCNGSETCSSCSKDCGACPPPSPVCGDGSCNGSETCSSCSRDCGACPPPPSSKPQCNDGIDNDADGKIDMNDPGCSSPNDNSEFNSYLREVAP